MNFLALMLVFDALLFSAALAEEPKPAPAKTETAAPAGKDIELLDGSKLHVEGDMYYTVKADGSKGSPAKGSYTLPDGHFMVLKDGRKVEAKED